MGLTDWLNVSDGLATVPGAPVTAVPWAGAPWPFALFATDASGIVRTAAGDPQNGLPAGWAAISDGLATVPGAPVTAVPWAGAPWPFALFATDASGIVRTRAIPRTGFPGWAAISDGLATVPGAPVTAVPWAGAPWPFALFATDASGIVRTAAGDPQNGLPAGWAAISDGLATVPGAPVTAVPWAGAPWPFALFATDASGIVRTAAGDPQNGLPAGWAAISDGLATVPGAPVTAAGLLAVRPFRYRCQRHRPHRRGRSQNGLPGWAAISDGLATVPGAPVTAVPWAGAPWPFALFATDASGIVRTAAGDPQNGLPAGWAAISDGLATVPGAPVTAVPWAGAPWPFALFATDASGIVRTAAGDPQNGLPGSWAAISDGLATVPGAPVTAVPWAGAPWPFALFATDASGIVRTAAGDPQNGLAGSWVDVSQGQALPGARVTAVPQGQGFTLLITDPNGGIFAATGDPQQGFGPWGLVEGITAKPGSPVTAVAFGDGLALFATDANGTIYARASSGGGHRLLNATATIKIHNGSFPDPMIVPGVTMSFTFNSDTRGFTVEEGFSPITLDGSGGSIKKITIQFDSAGDGSFQADGQITIPNFKITGTATIDIAGVDDDFSSDDTLTLSTGSVTSPGGSYTEMGSPADSPADALGNVTLVGAGQISGTDFSVRFAGC